MIYLLGNISNGIVPFLLLPVLTRYLTPAELGMVVSYQLLFSLCAALSTLNLNGAVSVEYFKGGTDRLGAFVASCLAIMLVGGLLVTSAVVMLASSLAVFELSRSWLFWCAISAALSGSSAIVLVIWQSAERPLPYIVFQFGQTFLNALMSVALVVYVGSGADGRLVGLAVPIILFGLASLFWLLVSEQGRGPISSEQLRKALRFGLPLLPHTLAAIGIAQGDRLILAWRIGLDEAGIYAVSMQLMLPLVMLADAINRAFAPWLFRQLNLGHNVDVAMGQYALIAIYICGAAAYLCVLYVGIEYFLGSGYKAAIDLVYYILPGTVGVCIYYAVVNPIFYAGRTELLTGVTVTGAFVYLVAGWFAAGQWGGQGLAVVYSIVCLFQSAAIFLLAQRVHRLPLAEGWQQLGGRLSQLLSAVFRR
jgi:O-antigen/teichoic acid export membrane protein